MVERLMWAHMCRCWSSHSRCQFWFWAIGCRNRDCLGVGSRGLRAWAAWLADMSLRYCRRSRSPSSTDCSCGYQQYRGGSSHRHFSSIGRAGNRTNYQRVHSCCCRRTDTLLIHWAGFAARRVSCSLNIVWSLDIYYSWLSMLRCPMRGSNIAHRKR